MTTQHHSSDRPQKGEMHRLIRSVSPTAETDHYAGKRHHLRLAEGMLFDAALDPEHPATVWPVTVCNLSEGGLGFWSKRPLVPGNRLHVREFSAEGDRPWLAVRVTHCTRGIQGYLIGVAVA